MIVTVYISGPMTGHQGQNYHRFAEAATRYRGAGYLVLNPSENLGGLEDVPREVVMRLDIQHVLAADAVVMLEGWQESVGAMLEHDVAREIGLPVIYDRPGEEALPREMVRAVRARSAL